MNKIKTTSRNNRTGLIGVQPVPGSKGKRFYSCVTRKGKVYYCGTHDSKKEACAARVGFLTALSDIL
ncbi:hypothetical protein ACJJVG_08820 [Pseudocitrobacter faecalis]|uniref:hypothetical protein n=1 Tax=Pseudocitrobacter faecalis TaxID=1398493 RepID=UPI00389A3430